MNIRFSPFRKGANRHKRHHSVEPVPSHLVAHDIRKRKASRKVSIVHPHEQEAYQLKARLLTDGHRAIETFFVPDSFLAVWEGGHAPDVIFIGDFIEASVGMTGAELVQRLRIQDKYNGLIYSMAADHRDSSLEMLSIEGFSGHVEHYFRGTEA